MAAAMLLTPLTAVKTKQAVLLLDRPSPSSHAVVRAFGKAFAFLPGWLDTPDPADVAPLAEMTAGIRATGRTGVLKTALLTGNPFLTSDGRPLPAEPPVDPADGGGE